MSRFLGVLMVGLVLPVLASGEGEHDHWAGYWEHFGYWSVNAIIFFAGLGYLLKKPASEFFGNRRANIKESLNRAEESRKQAAIQLEEIERQIANLDTEVKAILTQAEQDAAVEKERLIALAREDATRIGEQARADIENLSRSAQIELKTFLADLAVKEAEKVIVSSMTDAERTKLFVDFSTKLEASA